VTAPAAPAAPVCGRLGGYIGLVRCDYCGGLVDAPETRAALIAARRVRRGDIRGALRLLDVAATLNPRADRALSAENPTRPTTESRTA
jgi:hypothetical protein